METTVRRLAKILGASGVEGAGHDARFLVEGVNGDCLRVSLEGQQQRLMAVLQDSGGRTRATIDVAPITRVTEDVQISGRATVHIGRMMIHIDSDPALSIEIVTHDNDAG
jgi:hypothetical protein